MKDFGPFNKFYFPSEENTQNLIDKNIDSSINVKPTFYNPTSYSEATTIADTMISGLPVIVNLELLLTDENKKNEGKRMIDYLCGVAYVLHNNVMKINASTFYFSKE